MEPPVVFYIKELYYTEEGVKILNRLNRHPDAVKSNVRSEFRDEMPGKFLKNKKVTNK